MSRHNCIPFLHPPRGLRFVGISFSDEATCDLDEKMVADFHRKVSVHFSQRKTVKNVDDPVHAWWQEKGEVERRALKWKGVMQSLSENVSAAVNQAQTPKSGSKSAGRRPTLPDLEVGDTM